VLTRVNRLSCTFDTTISIHLMTMAHQMRVFLSAALQDIFGVQYIAFCVIARLRPADGYLDIGVYCF